MREIIIFILLLIAKVSFPQDMEKWVFQIEPRNNSKILGMNVYLTNNDSVFGISSIEETGIVSFEIEQNRAKQNLFIALRQNESIFKVSLEVLKDYQSIVETNFATISLKSITQLKYPVMPFPLADRRFYQRLDELGIYVEKSENYFPLDKLKRSRSYYQELIKERIDKDSFKSAYGHFPTGREIDSLAEIESVKEAEETAHWLGLRLCALEEPILCEGNKQQTIRFTWCKNREIYTYVPYCIRIEPCGHEGALMHLSYIRWDDCEENLVYHDIIPIEDSAYSTIVEKGRRSVSQNSTVVLDQGGVNNVLEVYLDGQYHVIFRGDGEDEGMEELREFLWGLTGLGENKIVHRRQRIE